jgi:hypothetical protein
MEICSPVLPFFRGRGKTLGLEIALTAIILASHSLPAVWGSLGRGLVSWLWRCIHDMLVMEECLE